MLSKLRIILSSCTKVHKKQKQNSAMCYMRVILQGCLVLSRSHIKISLFLPHKNFQRLGIGHLINLYTQILEVCPLLLWKFGLGSYSRFKIHWCLAPQFAVQWIKTTKFADFFGGHCRGLMDPKIPLKHSQMFE